MNEEILDLQSILEIPTTGQYDKETIGKLDDYIKESNFAATTEAKKILERNNSFGFSTEQTILDIRNLAKDSILAKTYEEDLKVVNDSIIGELNNSLSKEINVFNTFLELNQNDLAESYAQGGVLSYLRFADGGEITITGNDILKRLETDSDFKNKIQGVLGKSTFGKNDRRLRVYMDKLRENPNIKYTIDPTGKIRDVNSNTSDWVASEGSNVEDSNYKNSNRTPSTGKQLVTAGERKFNKVDEASQTDGDLFGRFRNIAAKPEETVATTEEVKEEVPVTTEAPEVTTDSKDELYEFSGKKGDPYKYRATRSVDGKQVKGFEYKDPKTGEWVTVDKENPKAFNAIGAVYDGNFSNNTGNSNPGGRTNGGGNNTGKKQDVKITTDPDGEEKFRSELGGKDVYGGGAGYSTSTPYNSTSFKGLPKEETKEDGSLTRQVVGGAAALAGGLGTYYGAGKLADGLKNIDWSKVKNPTKGLAGTAASYLSGLFKGKGKQGTPTTGNSSTIATPYNPPAKMQQLPEGKRTLSPQEQVKADEMVKEGKINTGTVTNPKATLPDSQKLLGGKEQLQLSKGKNSSTYVQDVMDKTGLDRTQLAQKVSKMTGKPLRTIKDKDILAVANKGKLKLGGRLFQQGGVNMNSQSKYSDQFKNRAGNVGISDGMGNNLKKEIARIDSELDGIMQELNKSRETKQMVGGTRSYSNVANNTDLRDKELRRHAETLIAQKKRLSQRNFGSDEKLNDSLLTMNKGGMTYKNGGMMNILLKKKVNIN